MGALVNVRLPIAYCHCVACVLSRMRIARAVYLRDLHKRDYLHAEDDVNWEFRSDCTCILCETVVDDLHQWALGLFTDEEQ